jgi:hypothetical protein
MSANALVAASRAPVHEEDAEALARAEAREADRAAPC